MTEKHRTTMTNSLMDKIGTAETGERQVVIGEKEQPEPIICNFCKGELHFKKVTGSFDFYKTPDRCSCEKAKKYWGIYDKRIAEINSECEEIEKKERRRIEVNRLIKTSHLGRRFKNRTFDTFEINEQNKAAFQISYDYASNFKEYEKEGKGLLYTGTVGTGKTHLAAAIANHLIKEKVIPVKFGNVTTLLSEIRSTYNGVTEATEGDVIRKLSTVNLLIIDDLGKENVTDWTNSMIYTIINNRYENYKPLIVTTNLGLGELEDAIGIATLSRLIEMCEGVKVDGVDYRKAKLM